MAHVGWRNPSTASYYLKLANVLRPGGPADLLSSGNSSVAASTLEYHDFNELNCVLFPLLLHATSVSLGWGLF